MRFLAPIVALSFVACYASHGSPTPGPADATPRPDAMDGGALDAGALDAGALDASTLDTSTADTGRPDTAPLDASPPEDPCAPPLLDLLLVIDDSASMLTERRAFSAAIAGLLEPFLANDAFDLRVGMLGPGLAHEILPDCSFDSDASLWRYVEGAPAGCQTRFHPPWLDAASVGAEQIVSQAQCLSRGTNRGCFIEQPLEAALRALSPTLRDFETGRGRGERENAGFLREDSFLLLVVWSDEDDCSLVDVDALLTRPPGALPSCLDPRDPLFPIEHYASAFRQLRDRREDRFGLIVLGGVPMDGAPALDASSLDRLLARPELEVRRDARDEELGIHPACVSSLARGYPAPRLVGLARALSPFGIVGSICAVDLPPLGHTMAERVGALRRDDVACDTALTGDGR